MKRLTDDDAFALMAWSVVIIFASIAVASATAAVMIVICAVSGECM